MALDTNIRGSTSGLGAEVNASNQLKVIPETDVATNPGNVGAVRFFSENDAGDITGTALLKSPETSNDYRLRVGQDTLAFDHTFCEATLDTTKWRIPVLPAGTPAAPTATLASGFLTLNAAGTTTGATAHISFVSQRYFRVRNTAPVYVEITGNVTGIPITNQVFEAGLFIPTGTAAPADGAWFQLTSAGVIGVMSYNGTITQTGVLVSPGSLPISNNGSYLITIYQDNVEFWIDNVLYATLELPGGQATPFLTDALPVGLQYRTSGVVAGTGQASLRVGDVGVTIGDIAQNRSWAAQMSGMGHHASQFQGGAGSTGTIASLPNATAATTVTGSALSQTVPIKAVATGGFGGEAGITAAVPGVDGMVFSFQNPVGSVTFPPRNLTIYGVRISAVVITALGNTPSTLQWALAYGATGATVPTLAVGETATLAALTVKQYRRIPLGFTSFLASAASGQTAPDINVTFNAPVTLAPGEWLAITAKFIQGIATGSFWTVASIDAHYD